jgi:hypothetical protein
MTFTAGVYAAPLTGSHRRAESNSDTAMADPGRWSSEKARLTDHHTPKKASPVDTAGFELPAERCYHFILRVGRWISVVVEGESRNERTEMRGASCESF